MTQLINEQQTGVNIHVAYPESLLTARTHTEAYVQLKLCT